MFLLPLTSAAIPHFLASVAKEGWAVAPKILEETRAFKNYLLNLGFKSQRADLYPRSIRRIMRANNLLIETSKEVFEWPDEIILVLKRMKTIASKPKGVLLDGPKTLREHRTQKQSIRVLPRTWVKIERTFKIYLQHQISQQGYRPSDGWEILFDADRVSDYLDFRNANPQTEVTANTGESFLSSLSKVLIFLKEMGELSADEKHFEFLKYQLWTLNKAIHETFNKMSNVEREALSGAIPVYESIYPSYLEYVFKAWDKIDSKTLSPYKESMALRNIILLILSIEFGWRPQDFATTLMVDHISRIEGPTQKPFFFFRYIPSITAWRKKPPIATAPFPPWFAHILSRYLHCLEKLSSKKVLSNRQFFPRLHLTLIEDDEARAEKEKKIAGKEIDNYNRLMTRMIKANCERAVGKPLTANMLRKSLASFFQRFSLPGLYMFTGRSASKETELQTQMEIKSYTTPGSSNPEALLSVRYGEQVKTALNFEEHIKKIEKRLFPKKSHKGTDVDGDL